MKFTHLLLALLVALIWGFNFIFVKIGLGQMSPYMLCAARFILASLPLMLFVKPPAISFKWVAAYGLVMFGCQFTFLFMGIQAGVSPGLASFIMQVQIFLTMLFAAIFWEEFPSVWQITGAIISFGGIGIIATHIDGNLTLTGFVCVLGGATAWALGNVITKTIGKVNVMSLMVWGSFVASIPMVLLTFYLDGTAVIVSSLNHLDWRGISALLFIVCLSTWVGYGCWSWLLSHYPVSSVSPFTLLIPIFSIASSAIILGESLPIWKLSAGALIVSGLMVNLFGARFFARKDKYNKNNDDLVRSDLIAKQNSS